MNKYLVTGATGFIGREVVHQLLSLGKEVTALGRTSPDEKISFIQADLTDSHGLEQALKGHKFEYIVHIASLPGDTGDSIQMVQVNINGCQNILEYARRSGVNRFVLTSSVSAYEWYPATKFNAPDYMPVDEEHPCRPKDMYSTTKRAQELLAMTYYWRYKVPTTALRLVAVVGPRGQGGGRGYRELAEMLAEGRSVKIPHFSADELCHYVDSRDVSRMHIAVAEHPKAVGEIFNCAGPEPTRGTEFADIVRRLVPGIKVEYGFPWSMAQGGEIAFDMSKTERLIGFKPRYSISDSLQNIKNWIDAGGLEKAKISQKESFGAGEAKHELI